MSSFITNKYFLSKKEAVERALGKKRNSLSCGCPSGDITCTAAWKQIILAAGSFKGLPSSLPGGTIAKGLEATGLPVVARGRNNQTLETWA